MKAVVYLSERLLQKCIDKGLDVSSLTQDPVRISVYDTLKWLMKKKFLHVEVSVCSTSRTPCYTFSIRKIKDFQIGCTLNFEMRFKDPYEAYEAGIEYCLDSLWDVGENEKKS